MKNNGKREELAAEVVRLAQDKLLVRHRFFDRALFRMQVKANERICGTDGACWYYVPEKLLQAFASDENAAVHLLLHSLLHNIFCHFFVGAVAREVWDAACDIMTESIVDEMQLHTLSVQQRAALEALKTEVSPLTAEKLYAVLRGKEPEEIAFLASLFRVDDHDLWYDPARENAQKVGETSSDLDEDAQSGAPVYDRGKEALGRLQAWKELAGRMQTELEHFGRGSNTKNLALQLTIFNRERQDYSAFLKRFVTGFREVMHVNLDEFDYTYYLYGLKTYGNLPLIEPLEYKVRKVISSLAIVIDTSGSVDRTLLEKFLHKTYDCIRSEESFSKHFDVHLIQCDNEVRSDVVVRSAQEMNEYLRTLTIRGRGGTDFRPAIGYIESLCTEGQLKNLKGILYFTDGEGVFPAKKPKFEVAFVYVGEEAFQANVHSWALKVVFSEDENTVKVI